KLRVQCFALSLDGYGAGPEQSLKNPLGVGGEALHEWFVPTLTLQALRVRGSALSFDGYGAGPEQSLKNPLGVGGEALHEWFVPTRTFQAMLGKDGGTTGPNADFS